MPIPLSLATVAQPLKKNSMSYLSEFTAGKDNNFNLIRILAALAVLVTHSFALATGSPSSEPFRMTLGITMGTIAVDIFFITSGFLVTGSLLSKESALEFVWARFLRIYPALVVMVVLTVFALGPYFTTLPLADYFYDRKTYIYLLKCSTLIGNLSFYLPGVFEENPYKGAINGSLWTMPYEIKMYGLLIAFWLILRLVSPKRIQLIKTIIIATASAAGAIVLLSNFNLVQQNHFIKLFYMFFTGASFYILQSHIKLHKTIFFIAVLTLIISPLIGKEIFSTAYHLTLAYILFYLAYIPAGMLRRYNKLGDYSYGVYIFAFPVQQSLVAANPGISATQVIAFSAMITIALAILSWHLLEKRTLRLKSRYVDYTRKIITLKPEQQ